MTTPARMLFLLSSFLGVIACNSTQPAPPSSPSVANEPLAVIDSSTAGSITGTISYKGPPLPKMHMLDMTQDPGCPSAPQAPETIALKSGKLANVFVYVKKGLPPGSFPVPSEAVVLDQQGCRYIPRVMGLMARQQLKILNTDSTLHNVHSMPANNAAWNESQMPAGQPILKTFPKPEMMLPLQCNQHPWMRAYVNVMTHPYFAVSGEDGTFEIKNLPPGEYTLAAVQEKFGEQTRKIKVEPKGTTNGDFIFSQGKL